MVEHMSGRDNQDSGHLEEYVQAVLKDAPEDAWVQSARVRLRNSLASEREENWIMTFINKSSRGRMKWAIAAPVAVLLLAGLFFALPIIDGDNRYEAFAQVAREIRAARTLVFTSVSRTSGTTAEFKIPEATVEFAFKEPGLVRTSQGSIISITDYAEGKSVILDPKSKEFTEIDLKNMPGAATSEESNQTEWLRNIPERADKVLGSKNLDSRSVTGYQFTSAGKEMTAWIDSDSGDLVTVEMEVSPDPMPEVQIEITMSNFKFDVPLDDSLFSMEMPSGFQRSHKEVDISNPDPKDLIVFLRFWASQSHLGEGFFPPSLNVTEIGKFVMEKMEKHPPQKQQSDNPMDSEEQKKKARESAEIFQKGFMFLPILSSPAFDWHYAGQGIKLGDATQPVCWWRPLNSETYKVILGDLSVIEVDPDQVPSNGKPIVPDSH